MDCYSDDGAILIMRYEVVLETLKTATTFRLRGSACEFLPHDKEADKLASVLNIPGTAKCGQFVKVSLHISLLGDIDSSYNA